MEQSNYRHSTQKIIYTEKAHFRKYKWKSKTMRDATLLSFRKDILLFYGRQWYSQARLFITARQSKYKPLLNDLGLVNAAKSCWLAAMLLLSIYVVLCINITLKIFDCKFESHLESRSFFRYKEQQHWKKGQERRASQTFTSQSEILL